MENIVKSPNDKRPLCVLFKLFIGFVFHLLPRTHSVWYDFHRWGKRGENSNSFLGPRTFYLGPISHASAAWTGMVCLRLTLLSAWPPTGGTVLDLRWNPARGSGSGGSESRPWGLIALPRLLFSVTWIQKHCGQWPQAPALGPVHTMRACILSNYKSK